MTVDEAYAEMKRRGWGFIRMGTMLAIGPITNPGYETKGEPPLINVIGVSEDPVKAVEKAIANETGSKRNR